MHASKYNLVTRFLDKAETLQKVVWQRRFRRWVAPAGMLFLLASFTFVLVSFLALQLQTWLVG